VELFLNGKSLGVKKNGKVVARHQIETTGEAVALKLVPDMETWHADGKELMHVRIYAVDKKGRRVLNVKDAKAFGKLTFQVKGDANIVAVDNGNIASDELHIGKTQLEKSIQRNLFQGSALVILRAGDKPGKIELSVAGEKMKAKKLVLNTK
jgi:beta-galactosidase